MCRMRGAIAVSVSLDFIKRGFIFYQLIIILRRSHEKKNVGLFLRRMRMLIIIKVKAGKISIRGSLVLSRTNTPRNIRTESPRELKKRIGG